MEKISFLLFFLSSTLCNIHGYGQSGIITTFAGNGIPAYSGDGGQATLAEIRLTTDVAIDGSGNVYFNDSFRVRKVSTSGIMSTIAGDGIVGYSGDGGPATVAHLNNPKGVALDTDGNIYIADQGNNCIRKVNTSGIISTIAGTGIGGYSGDGGYATNSKINNPDGVSIDKIGNLYIADTYNNRIRQVTPFGIINTVAGKGTYGFSGDGGPATNAQLGFPRSVSVDGSGNIYISDDASNRIRKVNISCIISTVAGNGIVGYSGDGSSATDAELWYPMGIAIDGSGNVYIADVGNNVVRKLDTFGIINTVAGTGGGGYSGDGGPATIAELNDPEGVAIDSSGNIYIADLENFRIRKISHTLGVPDVSAATSDLNIYPNPANDVLTIQTDGSSFGSFSISNMLGVTVLRGDVTGAITKVDIHELSEGVYDLTLEYAPAPSREGINVVRNFVKE